MKHPKIRFIILRFIKNVHHSLYIQTQVVDSITNIVSCLVFVCVYSECTVIEIVKRPFPEVVVMLYWLNHNTMPSFIWSHQTNINPTTQDLHIQFIILQFIKRLHHRPYIPTQVVDSINDIVSCLCVWMCVHWMNVDWNLQKSYLFVMNNKPLSLMLILLLELF